MKNLLQSLVLAVVFLAVGCGDGIPVEQAADIDVQGLIAKLDDPSKDVRYQACVDLSTGLETSAPALDKLIELMRSDKDAQVREMAGYAIYQMGEEIGKPAMAMVKERYPKERASGVRSMLINLWNRFEPETSPTAGAAKGGNQP